MKLSEVFSQPESLVDGAVLFVDMTNSTSMKEKESEATWLTTYAWFFDLVGEKVKESGGVIVKYLGDGVMAYYDLQHVASAINAAIRVQETLKQAIRDKHVYVNCTAGIASGKFRAFQTGNEARDYIGNVVDKAARLSSVASSNAIFVDRATINSALMVHVESQLGKLLNWSVDDYVGDQQKITLKGFSQSVTYHEIKWDQQLYGLKSQVATAAVEEHDKRAPQQLPASTEASTPPKYEPKLYGILYRWLADKGFGFITEDKSKAVYYTNLRYVVGNYNPSQGSAVYFLDRDPLGGQTHRLAAAVTVVGSTLFGSVSFINNRDPVKQMGLILVKDEAGNEMGVFAFLGRNELDIRRDEVVEFDLGFATKGPSALNIRRRSGGIGSPSAVLSPISPPGD